jgi:hypothetical protein
MLQRWTRRPLGSAPYVIGLSLGGLGRWCFWSNLARNIRNRWLTRVARGPPYVCAGIFCVGSLWTIAGGLSVCTALTTRDREPGIFQVTSEYVVWLLLRI